MWGRVLSTLLFGRRAPSEHLAAYTLTMSFSLPLVNLGWGGLSLVVGSSEFNCISIDGDVFLGKAFWLLVTICVLNDCYEMDGLKLISFVVFSPPVVSQSL